MSVADDKAAKANGAGEGPKEPAKDTPQESAKEPEKH